MQLSLQTFSNLVQSMGAAAQGASNKVLDLTVGSTLRAIFEANAAIALWMQWLIVQVLQATRAATSSGDDLDSWMADFTLERLPASAASGVVTLSRLSPAITALIPPGTLVRTADGTQVFTVEADNTNPAWVEAQNGYVMGAGVTSVDVPVTAQIPGTGGNVQAAAISVLATALPGVDDVSNATDLMNGIEAETDAAFRLRFQGFIASRSRATPLAIENAVASVQQGLTYTILENRDASGAVWMGNFIVTVDDGSGFPSASLLSSVQQAVEAVRPIGSTFAVFPPTVTQITVAFTIDVSAGTAKTLLVPRIVDAVASYVNALTIGESLAMARIVQVAFATDERVVNVTHVLLNGQPVDIAVPPDSVIKTSVVVVS